MQRREFLVAGAAAMLCANKNWADDLPADARITRIVGFDMTCRRSKTAGKNSRLDVHGDQVTDRMARFFTNTGVEGIGHCRAKEDTLRQMLGQSPRELFDTTQRRMTGPLGASSGPLWDLAGKLLNKPVYELLGARGAERVPVYDGSIYFQDLLPQYSDCWRDRFREEIDMALARGHRAVKVKIGRGAKWMPTEEGFARDVEVLKTIREHAGAQMLIGVDANNGYDLVRTKRLFGELPDYDLAFVEEMFPEEVEKCLELKEFIASSGLETLVADGETQSRLEAFRPFVKAQAIDVLQGDMNRFGIEGIMTEAQMAAAGGLRVAPHNWGSLIGFYMQLTIGRAIGNFYRAEHDPLDSDILVAAGYEIRDGACSVPDAPGFGLSIDRKAFAAEAKVWCDVRV